MFLKSLKIKITVKRWKKITAVVLSLLSLLQPLQAYDTDIVSTLSGGKVIGKPNVLFILDTSDSMNIALPWHELTEAEDGKGTYNSHIEYLWNDEDYIASIGCSAGRDGANSCLNNVNSTANKYNSPPLTNADVLTKDWLVQGYFATPALKQTALNYARATTSAHTPSGKPRSLVRNYGGYTDQFINNCSPRGDAKDGPFICTKPLRSNYVWWSDKQNTFNNAATPDNSDAQLYSNSFNRFIAEDAINNFSSSSPSNNDIRRGGSAYGQIVGISADNPSLIDKKNLWFNPIDANDSNNKMGSMCFSSFFGGIYSGISGFIPSTAYAPGPYEKNQGYMVSGWYRWQPFANRQGINLDKYPGVFARPLPLLSGVLAGHRDGDGDHHNPIRVRRADGTSYSGWESLQPDLGNYLKYFAAVYNFSGGPVNGSSDFPEYGNPGSSDVNNLRKSDTKLKFVLEQYGINENSARAHNQEVLDVNTRISEPLFNLTPSPMGNRPDFWNGAYRNDNPFYSYMAMRGGEDYAPGPAGRLSGIGSYIDVSDGQSTDNKDLCKVQCTLGLNPPSLIGQPPLNSTSSSSAIDAGGGSFANYSGPISCVKDIIRSDKDCSATCDAFDRKITIRNITQCSWKDRKVSAEQGESEIKYSGGTCTATCTGDCDNFSANYNPSIKIGKNTFNQQTDATTTTSPISQVCQYDRSVGELPADKFGVDGTCTLKPNITPGPVSESCVDYYGGANPNCKTYSNNTPQQVCERTENGTKDKGIGGILYDKYKLSQYREVLIHECSADNGRSSSESYLANQLNKGFNYSSKDTGSNGGVGAMNMIKKPLSANEGDYENLKNMNVSGVYTPSGVAVSNVPNNAVVYSSNYLNFIYGPKGPYGRPIGRQTRLQVAKDVLVDLVDENKDNFRFGLLAFNDASLSNKYLEGGTAIGGHVVFPISDLSDINNPVTRGHQYSASTNDLAEFKKRVLWLEAKSKTPLTETLFEAYLYYSGKPPNAEATSYYDQSKIPPQLALNNITNGSSYLSPIKSFIDSYGNSAIPPVSCLKNVIIMITDGGPQGDTAYDSSIKRLEWRNQLTNAAPISPKGPWPGLNAAATADGQFAAPNTTLPYGPTDDDDKGKYAWLDELAYFMNHASVYDIGNQRTSVQTYAIGFGGVVSPVLRHAGNVGAGDGSDETAGYFDASDASTLASAIKNALGATRDFIPTLSAPTVPLSALSKAQDSNDIYVSAIKPIQGTPMWGGNMKKYHLEIGEEKCGKDVTGTPINLCLGGQSRGTNGNSKVNVATSMQDPTNPSTWYTTFDTNAQSYWSPTSDGADPLQGGVMSTLPHYYPDNGASGGGKGRGRVMKTFFTQMYDTSGSVSNNPSLGKMIDVTYSEIGDSKALVGGPIKLTDQSTIKSLINKLRGADLDSPGCSANTSSADCTAWGKENRHEAPLHSSGTVLTYKFGGGTRSGNTSTAPDQLLFYSTINGVLHAVRTADKLEDNGGKEVWSFVPEEAIRGMVTHPDNADIVNSGGDKVTQGPIALLDGQPMLYTQSTPGKDGAVNFSKAILIFGMRRGGSSYYALDVRDPQKPEFLWKIVGGMGVAGQGMLCRKNGACENRAEFDELGQTWSVPVVIKLNQAVVDNSGRPTNEKVRALVFGGGYDPRQDCMLPKTTPSATNPAGRFLLEQGTKNDRLCQGKEPQDTMGRAVYLVSPDDGAPIKIFTRPSVIEAAKKAVSSGKSTAFDEKVFSEIISISDADVNTEADISTGVASGITMSFSIPSSIGAYNIDGNAANTVERLYVGDMGGLLWRFDIDNSDSANWRGYPIASLSTVDASSKLTLNDRPIYFTPTLFLSLDNAGIPAAAGHAGQKYDYVYVGSGDMEHPITVGNGVDNKLFMIKDWEYRLLADKTGKFPSGNVRAKDLRPVVAGYTDGKLGYDYCISLGSCLVNITSLSTTNGKSPRADFNALSDRQTGINNIDNVSGWYLDLDYDDNAVRDFPEKWREIVTSGVLIYKDENPASATYGQSVLNVSTFRYGVQSTNSCLASGQGRLLTMEATTGAAFAVPTSSSGGNGSNAGAGGTNALVSRIGGKNNGGFEQGATTSSSVVGQPTLRILNCQIFKIGLSGADFSSSYVGSACTAQKTYWYNELSN